MSKLDLHIQERFAARRLRFYHATNLREFAAYCSEGAVVSREVLLGTSQLATRFYTDDLDGKLGVLGRTFGNIYDFGAIFSRVSSAIPNIYGPISLVFRPTVWAQMGDIRITKKSVATLKSGWRRSVVSDTNVVDQIVSGRREVVHQDWQYAEVSCQNERLSFDQIATVLVEPVQVAGRDLRDLVKEELVSNGHDIPVVVRSYKADTNSRGELGELAALCARLDRPVDQDEFQFDQRMLPRSFANRSAFLRRRLGLWCRYFCYGTVAYVEEADEERYAAVPLWEEYAIDAVESSLGFLDMDEDEGTVTIGVWDEQSFGLVSEQFDSFVEVQKALSELADEALYAYAPFEGGEPVFDLDSTDIVDSALDKHGIVDFFYDRQ